MDVDAAADELYGLTPDLFTARRTELAAQARADGDAAARAAIGQLRRPTTAAWLVNLVVRSHPREVDDLLRLGAQLREAQRNLDGAQLRELTAHRRTAITGLGELARSAAAEAGHRAGEDALRDVQSTFEAAVADDRAEDAVRTGRLTTALSYSGFGEVDVSDAVAGSQRPHLTVVRSPDPDADRATTPTRSRNGKQQRQESNHLREQARRVAAERARDAEAAAKGVKVATGRRDRLAAERERLERELGELQQELRAADAEVRSAKAKHDSARRAAERAADRLT